MTDGPRADRNDTLDPVVEGLDRALSRDGYAIIPGLLDAAELAEARSELSRLLPSAEFGKTEFELPKTRRVGALFAKTRAFDTPATYPLILALLDRRLERYQLGAPFAVEVHPGERPQFLHRDEGIYPLPQPANVVISTLWAIDEFTEVNGATRLVAGSHLWTDGRPDRGTETVAAEMAAGSVLVFLGSLFHGAGANRSDRPRLGVILDYVSSWLRPAENNTIAVPREIAMGLGPRLQELLGYNRHSDFLGYVDFRHPREVLQR